jgi:catechol 2,3-dioxygenase-like lactoylglutathione lyase family enzyme
MPSPQFRKLAPVLIVDAVEPCLGFWTDRLGFTKALEVPEGEKLGFVILVGDGIEVMYQSRASVRNDIPVLADTPPGSMLYVEVADVAAIERKMKGLVPVVPRRKTFYGADEIGFREPGGNVVLFAQPEK